jgi:hypothetical protein
MLLSLLALGTDAAVADDWPGPRVFSVFSGSGQYFVRFVPGESVGDTVGFSGARTGRYATALLYGLQSDRSYRVLHEVTLTNPVSPVNAFVSDKGYFVTLDNWHNLGFGKVVAIYGPSGMLIRSYELTGLYSSERLEKIPRSVSSRYWRCEPAHFVGPEDQTSLYVPEVLGGSFVFTLSTGSLAYTSGSRSRCVPPRGPLSSTLIGN